MSSWSHLTVGGNSYTFDVAIFKDSSIQPSVYSGNSKAFQMSSTIIEISVCFGGFLTIIVLLAIRSHKSILPSLDLYAAAHNHFADQIMYLKQNLIGGTFSVVFIFLAVMEISVGLLWYFTNNTAETKNLVPLVVLEEEVSKFQANLTISIGLINYGGNCIINSLCSPEIGYQTVNLQGEWSGAICELRERNCYIKLSCKNCEIKGEALISFEMDNFIGYTSGYFANITSTSSIPNQISSYSTYALPDESLIFIGPQPTTVYFTMIPSYYKELQTGQHSTGYHTIVSQNPDKGSEFHTYELGLAHNSYLDIVLIKGSDGLYTTKNQIQTFNIFISTLLGSVFGIMGSVGAIMKLIEKNILKLKRKVNSRKHTFNMQENSLAIYVSCGNLSKPENSVEISKEWNNIIDETLPTS